VTSRLTSVSVRGLPGLPETATSLKPLTALIGPRAVGKSRLLAAIAWLLTGDPPLDAGARSPVDSGLSVEAELGGDGSTRSMSRRAGEAPVGDPPPARFWTARDRVSPLPEDAPLGWSDAAQAERMVEDIAEKRLAGVTGEIVLIEEPELMLTPHQQRHLYSLLRRFTEQGNQVIYSTRSPAMLDATRYDEIVRLDRTTHGMRVRRAPDQLLTDLQRVRLAAEFDHERNEMFFATSVVLVEGQTERQSFPTIFLRLGYDADALGISIVEAGGKGNLILLARVLAELRIPHLIVHDSDRGRPGQRENDYIKRNAGRAPVFQLHPDFEAVAGIRAHDHKVFNAVRRFKDMPEERIPSVFREIADTAADLASGERQ
jgi:predicted ATP-dependent endonuclease of OLD family